MDELKKALESVPDKYSDFVNGISGLLSDDEEYQQKVTQFIKDNPEAQTSDVLIFLRPYLDSLEDGEDEDYEEDEDAS